MTAMICTKGGPIGLCQVELSYGLYRNDLHVPHPATWLPCRGSIDAHLKPGTIKVLRTAVRCQDVPSKFVKG